MTVHVPAVNSARVHDVAEPTVYEQVFVCDPSVALIVAVSPLDPPITAIVGVVSFVRLSVLDDPVSESAIRSEVGAAGAVLSTVTDVPLVLLPGPLRPSDAVVDEAVMPGTTVPSEQPETVMVNVDALPEVGDALNVHPVADPPLLKSAPVKVAASIAVSNVKV